MASIDIHTLNQGQNDYLFVDQNNDGLFDTSANSTDYAFKLSSFEGKPQKLMAQDANVVKFVEEYIKAPGSTLFTQEGMISDLLPRFAAVAPKDRMPTAIIPRVFSVRLSEVKRLDLQLTYVPQCPLSPENCFVPVEGANLVSGSTILGAMYVDDMYYFSYVELSVEIARILNVDNPVTKFVMTPEVLEYLHRAGYYESEDKKGYFVKLNSDGSGKYFDMWRDSRNGYMLSAITFMSDTGDAIEAYEEQEDGSVLHNRYNIMEWQFGSLPL